MTARRPRASFSTLEQLDVTAPPRPSEQACQETIVDAAMKAGWLVHAQRPARTTRGWRTAVQGHAGFPDLVLITPSRTELHIVELKRKPNKLEPAQDIWIRAFGGIGIPVYPHVWWVPEGLPAALEFIRLRGRRR